MSSPERNCYAARVTIGYAIAATLWIFFSDQWLTYLTDLETVRSLSTAKGMAFVVVTAALLFLALRSASDRRGAPPEFRAVSWPLLTVFLALTVAIGTIGFAAYRFQSDSLRDNALTGLKAVAELKVEGISRWLAERRANARSLSGSPVLQTALIRWLESGAPGDRAQVAGLLQNLCDSYNFADLAIFDMSGRPLLGNRSDSPAPATAPETIGRVLASGQPLLLDLERQGKNGPAQLGFIAPLYLPGAANGARQPLGAIRFDLRPEDFLYPFLGTWPLGSASGESLLARQDGEDVLFLSPLRYRPDAALELRLPLSTPDLPLARALRFQEHLIAGRDYRKVPVLTAALPVPDTPWILVAKMDEEEALAGTRRLLAVTGVLVAAALSVAAAILVLLWQRQRLHWALHEVAQSRQVAASEAKLRSYIEHSPVAVFVVDEAGRFIESNPAGLELSGHDTATLRTLTIADTIVESDRERALADFAELVRTGIMEAEYQGLARNGRMPYVLIRAARISESRFIGFSQDITERRLTEQALRQAQKLARLGSYAYDIVNDRSTCFSACEIGRASCRERVSSPV